MAQISSIGAGIYTELAYTSAAITLTSFAQSDWEGLTYTDVSDVRDFPTFGAPANIVNVPNYGQAQSSQIAAQADAPTLEFTLNYVPSEHATLQGLAGDDVLRGIRLRIANAELPETLLAATEHSDFYIEGKIAAFQVIPSLSDSNQATLTIATQGDYYGPFTTS